MMDKKPHIKPYLYGMLAGFGAISLSILFFFLIYRFQGFGDAISKLTGILMPFIYGAVIAYLLKPVCNCVENFLRRLLPEKMGTAANMLAVTISLLFGILVVYALIMMIVPQLITSVTTLYYTARNNLNDFVDWASHQEIIASNQKLLDFIETSYDNLQDTLDNLVRTKLVPSMQSLLSGAALGVMSFVTFLKNIVIGLIVSVYLLASRKKFGQQGTRTSDDVWAVFCRVFTNRTQCSQMLLGIFEKSSPFVHARVTNIDYDIDTSKTTQPGGKKT